MPKSVDSALIRHVANKLRSKQEHAKAKELLELLLDDLMEDHPEWFTEVKDV